MQVPTTDWDSIYLRIRMSEIGCDYPRDTFLRTPIGHIRTLLKAIDEKYQHDANIASISAARLNELLLQVAHGFSGAKGAPPHVSAREFLPFPDYNPNKEDYDGPSDSTKIILQLLYKKRQIPTNVFVGLITPSTP